MQLSKNYLWREREILERNRIELEPVALHTAREPLSEVKDERLQTTRMALDIQRKRIAAAELGEEYTNTLDSLMA